MKLRLVEFAPGEWEMEEPSIVSGSFEEFYDAIEIMHSSPRAAEKKLISLISKCRGLHIDAVLHLGFLKNEMGSEIEGNALINKAHQMALAAIPDGFDEKKSEILWGFMENRPFLRTFHAIGLELMKEGDFETASEKLRFGINVNPNDNQGLRYLLLECYFQLKNPEEALRLHKEYGDEWSLDFRYGAVLAHLQTGDEKKAKKALKSAVSEFPLGAKEILKKRHPEPENEGFGDGIVMGSEYEAWDYWVRMGDFWKDTAGAIEFVRNNT